MTSCLYVGTLRHRRSRPTTHEFRYRVFMFYLDLDELPAVALAVGPLSINRFNLVSFHDRDYVDGQPGSPKDKVLDLLHEDGIDLPGGKVYVLTNCRILGYVFNPISLYYCHAATGELAAIVAEVTSTFGERYLYRLTRTLTGASRRDLPRRYRARKVLHVSPFISMDAVYDFHLSPIGNSLRIGIVQHEHGTHVLDAQLWGRRVSLTTASLARVLLTHPLMTLKTVGAIHLEALRLYLKGVPVHRRPPPTREQRAQRAELAALAPNADGVPTRGAPPTQERSPLDVRSQIDKN